LLTQLLLDHRLGSISIPTISYPWDFLILFASSALIMAIPAISVTRYIVPPPAVETVREPLLTGVFGGLRDFVRNRLLMLTSIALMLMIVGNDTILPSVVLYTQAATGAEPQQYAGFQFALRFTFKVVAGLFLGWLLTRTYPRAGLLATTSLSLCGLLWGLLVPGKWFLVSFGLLGAGELYGVYFPNYLVSCSRLADVRRNLAYANLLALPVAMAPVIFGIISDNYGLRSSIALAALLLVGTIFVVQIALPRRPSFNLPDGGR
jgi:fucose permease